MKKWLGILVVLLLLAPIPVGAHSYVIESKPSEGSEVTEKLSEIILTFNAGIESVSTAIVLNDQGEEMPIRDILVDSPLLIMNLAESLLPGSYTVEWRALGEDTHQTEGSFSFDVLENNEVDLVEESLEIEEDLTGLDGSTEHEEEIRSVDEEATVDASLGRLFLPILLTGAIALIFLVKVIIKRIR